MKFLYHIQCGSGNEILELKFIDTELFKINYQKEWMGSDKIKLELTGKYENYKNNYYFLVVDEVYNIVSDEKINIDGHLTFEVIILTSKQSINSKDHLMEFLTCAGSAFFNDENNSFDAIIYNHPQSYDEYCNDKIELISGFIKNTQLCKLLKIEL